MAPEREVDAEVVETKPKRRKRSSESEESVTIDDVYDVLSDISETLSGISESLVDLSGEDGVGDGAVGELARIADCLEAILQGGSKNSSVGNLLSSAGDVIAAAVRSRGRGKRSGGD